MSTTPDYTINYEDERFTQVETEKDQALAEVENTYGGMIDNVDKYYDEQIQLSKDWADKQAQIQQENTDFAIEKIEQQKEQANKDYLKEQSGAYVDWRKQSNQYGTEAEKMASSGLSNTGYSESSQVSMYNTYQNRIATARESYNLAVLNYNNSIKDAQLQNNAALAEIAYNSLQQQLELSLQGFQYKNQLLIEQSNKKMEVDNIYYNRWQDVLNQMNTENAMAENIRQFESEQQWKTEQAELDRQHTLKRDELNRQFQAEQAELDRKHAVELEKVKDKYAKEQLKLKHEQEMAALKKQQEYKMAQLDKELANEKALLSYQKSLTTTSVSGTKSSGSSKSSTTTSKKSGTKTTTTISKGSGFTGTSYDDAIAYMKNNGVDGTQRSALMTQSEWSRRRSSYLQTGQGSSHVKNYSSYSAYLKDYVNYCVPFTTK